MKLTTISLFALAVCAAQAQDNGKPSLTCDDNRDHDGRRSRSCEIREQTIAYAGQLNIDGRQNGGVSVKGWTRSDVLVRMKIEANAPSEGEAKAIASQIRVNTGAGRISADGPSSLTDSGWAVSFEVFTPQQSNVEITTRNGGVSVSDVRGNIQFTAVNGGVHLARVNGKVHGETMNGGVSIELAGNRWDGEGLDVKTTNGGVTMKLPSNYSAQLEGSTVNGGFKSDFDLGADVNKERRVKANLNSGGAPLRVTTTNGGVRLAKI